MADEAKKAVDAAADMAKANVVTAGEAAKTAIGAAETASKQTAETTKQTAEAAKPAPKTAAKSGKRVAKAQKKTASKKNNRRAKARPTRPAGKPQPAAANGRTHDMNYDPKNWFAAFSGAPVAPFQTLFAEAGERGQEVVRRSQKTAEELADLTRANVEALVDSGRIAAEGARSIGQDVVESSRQGLEQAADAVRSLAEAKSATEFVQLQSEFARSSFDRIVNESSRLTESMVKIAGEAFQPISNRASLNAERLNKLVA